MYRVVTESKSKEDIKIDREKFVLHFKCCFYVTPVLLDEAGIRVIPD